MNNLLVLAFSMNRAAQLDLMLRSYRLHMGPSAPPVVVLYKCTGTYLHQETYGMVARENPLTVWIREKEGKFGQQVVRLLEDAAHVLFLVDDTVFTRELPFVKEVHVCRDCSTGAMGPGTMGAWTEAVGAGGLTGAVAQLRDERILGVSLRLGKNTTICYPEGDKPQKVPHMLWDDGWCTFDWTEAKLDFAYPLELSSSIYRTADILAAIKQMPGLPPNPNRFEYWLSLCKDSFANRPWPALSSKHLVCPQTSAAFSNPMNKVQTTYNNRSGDISPDEMAQQFALGQRLDLEQFNGFVSTGCHQYVEPRWVERERV